MKLPEGLIATALATTYTVALSGAGPSLDEFNEMLGMTVVYRDPGSWSINRYRNCLGTDGQWAWESNVLDRPDDWLQTHRFTLSDALQAAENEALRMYESFLVVQEHKEK